MAIGRTIDTHGADLAATGFVRALLWKVVGRARNPGHRAQFMRFG